MLEIWHPVCLRELQMCCDEIYGGIRFGSWDSWLNFESSLPKLEILRRSFSMSAGM